MRTQQKAAADRAVTEKSRELRALTARSIGGELLASEQRQVNTQIEECEKELAVLEHRADRLGGSIAARELIPPTPSEMQGAPRNWPTPTGLQHEGIYRPDAGVSFIRDLVFKADDPSAAERLAVNQRQAEDRLRMMGDITTVSSPGLGGVLPPVYLADFFATFPRSGRPFADALGSHPLPVSGLELTIPRLTGGTSVAGQAVEADAVSETDADTDTLTAPVVTIAGQQDVSRQAIERTLPVSDTMLLADLLNAYDQELDRQLLVGTGSSGQHRGLSHASGSVNTVTYTTGSPTGKLLVKQIANAASQIAETRFLPADMILMHPRRAAYLASEYDADTPVLPSGSTADRAVGFSSKGGPADILGLPCVFDPNLPTTGGAGTNQDELWVLRAADMLLFEDPVRQFKFQEVLSGTLQIRLQCFSYSAFFADRWPQSICSISGTGLVTPTWS